MTYIRSWPSLSVDAPHMRLVLVDGPAVEPLTADEARARLNIGTNVTDEVMNAYIMAARQVIDGADGYLGRALVTQSWLGNLDTFPADCSGRIMVPLPPLQEVTELSYLDAVGASVDLSYLRLSNSAGCITTDIGQHSPRLISRYRTRSGGNARNGNFRISRQAGPDFGPARSDGRAVFPRRSVDMPSQAAPIAKRLRDRRLPGPQVWPV